MAQLWESKHQSIIPSPWCTPTSHRKGSINDIHSDRTTHLKQGLLKSHDNISYILQKAALRKQNTTIKTTSAVTSAWHFPKNPSSRWWKRFLVKLIKIPHVSPNVHHMLWNRRWNHNQTKEEEEQNQVLKRQSTQRHHSTWMKALK